MGRFILLLQLWRYCSIKTRILHKTQYKQLKFDISIPATLHVHCDRNILLTIIRNIVDNAMKFSSPNSIIKVYALENQGYTIINIQDFGTGMTGKQLETIFQLQQNKSQEGTQGEKGTGIAMVLVKELMDLVNGKIDIQSQLNQGTTVSLQLPV